MIDNKKKTNTALVFINNSILKVIKKKINVNVLNV